MRGLLTAYNGVPRTYDGAGNPLNDGTWTYTWQNGRELASMTDGDTTWFYTYDGNGMRAQRSNGTTAYSYVYNGSQLSQMTVGGNTLNFAYDASGMPMMVTYNGTNYYYIVNLQGDVMGIVDSTGTIVVNYTYDAWGKPLSITGAMADTLGVENPLRYRSYVYDQETGLYYLQSRYYDPEIGRFINADGYVSTGQGFVGNNMFAYCLNNPVVLFDFNGFRAMVRRDIGGTSSDPVVIPASNYGANIDNMMKFYGVKSPEEVPALPDGAMVFMENIHSVSVLGLFSYVRGYAIVMDSEKYCEYIFTGFSLGVSGIAFDKTTTGGYVYGVNSVDDYAGVFVGGSSYMLRDGYGFAVAPNSPVYAEVHGVYGYLAPSIGISRTKYTPLSTSWVYGSAPISWHQTIPVSYPYGNANYIM